MRAALALLTRELRLAARLGGGGLVGVIFFLALVTVVPFGVGPDLALLSRIGPGILWIGALLGTLLALDRLFQADEEDGSLDPRRRPRRCRSRSSFSSNASRIGSRPCCRSSLSRRCSG